MSKDLYLAIGSVTKSYVATMVLQLVDDGLVKLDAPIGEYLPGLVLRENEITIRHLLEMRSGLGDYGLIEGESHPWPRIELYEKPLRIDAGVAL